MANAKINRRSTGTKRPADVGGGRRNDIYKYTNISASFYIYEKPKKEAPWHGKRANPKNNFHFGTCCALYGKRFSALLYIFLFKKRRKMKMRRRER
jgi:hypothetical protein